MADGVRNMANSAVDGVKAASTRQFWAKAGTDAVSAFTTTFSKENLSKNANEVARGVAGVFSKDGWVKTGSYVASMLTPRRFANPLAFAQAPKKSTTA